mmetsp:Transcript_10619/g.22567  ORF Transcript_10619/g.22567 Transcript_10619/m.22567 type:complete len:207 (+) Transcript_10619:50-670(+)
MRCRSASRRGAASTALSTGGRRRRGWRAGSFGAASGTRSRAQLASLSTCGGTRSAIAAACISSAPCRSCARISSLQSASARRRPANKKRAMPAMAWRQQMHRVPSLRQMPSLCGRRRTQRGGRGVTSLMRRSRKSAKRLRLPELSANAPLMNARRAAKSIFSRRLTFSATREDILSLMLKRPSCSNALHLGSPDSSCDEQMFLDLT